RVRRGACHRGLEYVSFPRPTRIRRRHARTGPTGEGRRSCRRRRTRRARPRAAGARTAARWRARRAPCPPRSATGTRAGSAGPPTGPWPSPAPTARPPAAPGRARAAAATCWSAATRCWRRCAPATRLFLANSLEKDVRVNEAAKLAGDAGVEISEVPRAELDRRCDSNGLPGAAHQGIALQVRPYRYWSAEDLLDAAKRSESPALIVALDGVTDPHNLGAVARSAAAFGAHGILIPERRSAGVTMAAWKTSAGTLARLPVAQTVNLTRALEAYKQEGLFTVGLDAGGDTRLDEIAFAA